MDQFPTEIVEKIFTSYDLSILDVVNASATCKHLRDELYNNDRVWKSLYYHNLPVTVSHLLSARTTNTVDWLEEIKYVYEVKSKVRRMLETMPDTYYSVPNIGPSELTGWDEFIKSSPAGTYYIVMWYLNLLICDYKQIHSFSVVSLFTPGNKTLRYYCLKVMEYLRHSKLTQDYEGFMQLDEKQRILEKVATFVAQWCQPTKIIRYKDIEEQLDQLAASARQELFAVNPKHPLFQVPKETLLDWKSRNLEKHQFDGNRCQEILNAINHTLYRQHRFSENRINFYDPKNSYINYVLRREVGLPILLCIVYESVARRMGVNCEPVNVPSHFLLRYLGEGNGRTKVQYVYAANQGALLASGACPYSAHYADSTAPPMMSRANAAAVMLRMAANLENALQETTNSTGDLAPLRQVLELSVLVAPSSLNMVLNLARLCMSVNMDARYVEQIILHNNYDEQQNAENVLQMLRDYEVHREHEHIYEQSRVKRRPRGLKFAVGQVMRHKLYNYAGVITAWTERCEASAEWQKNMNIDRLQRRNKQPFYYVVVDDGTNRYVAEENIWIINEVDDTLLEMEELGRHFSHFHGTAFVPNSAKEREYPEDKSIRERTRYNENPPT